MLFRSILLGRVYCSIICPLGVFQDVVSNVSSRIKKNRFRYSHAINWLRYGVLALFIIAFILGIGSLVALLEPYSAYGRIVSNLFAPLYQWGNNLLAFAAEQVDSYAFYENDVYVKRGGKFAVDVGVFVGIVMLAWYGGCTYCNPLCA